jgi:hypothetical protein
VYQFSGELRKPTVKIAATDKWRAIAWFARRHGLPDGTVVLPRAEIEFEPQKHLNKVEVVDEDVDELWRYPQELPERQPRSRSKYGDAGPDEYPLLSHFGRGSIRPEWIIDRRTGKVVPAGEFDSFPRYFLDLRQRPTPEEVARAGGKINVGGGMDVEVGYLKSGFPWLNIEDGEDLRTKLLAEIDRYERTHS